MSTLLDRETKRSFTFITSPVDSFNKCFLVLAFAFLGASWLILAMRRSMPSAAIDAKAAH
jgi:hypothetical protein